MGKFLLKRPRIISKKFPRVESHIDGVTKSLEGLVFSYSREVDKALQKKRLLMLLSSMVLIMVLGSFISPKGKADSAIFHPQSCLGGWVNPSNAEGEPVTTSNTDEAQFTQGNSAILPTNTLADMYCGNFVGQIEKNTRPTKILVSLAWTKGENIILEQKITSDSFASSSAEILDSASTTEVSFTLTETNESTTTPETSSSSEAVVDLTDTQTATSSPSVIEQVIDVVETIIDKIFPPEDDVTKETAPVPEAQTPEQSPVQEAAPAPTESVTPLPTTPVSETPPVSTPPPEATPAEPVSFIDIWVRKIASNLIYSVHAAEENSTSTESVTPPEVSTSSEITPPKKEEENAGIVTASSTDLSTSTEILSATTTHDISFSSTTEATSTEATSTEATSTEEITPSVTIDPESDDMATNNFLEVLYTFDGVTWSSLGKVNEISMKYRTFEIPVTATTSWNDMAQLQIKIERLERVDETPTVYLDGMHVEVLYETPVIHEHPDFARDTILKDKVDDGVRVISIINSDTNTNEIWYTTIDTQGEYGVAPGTWVEVNLNQASSFYKLIDIYGRNIFWVDEVGKLLWVTNLQKETNDGIGLVVGASTTVSFTKTNGEEWIFEYNHKTKTGIAKIKQ